MIFIEDGSVFRMQQYRADINQQNRAQKYTPNAGQTVHHDLAKTNTPNQSVTGPSDERSVQQTEANEKIDNEPKTTSKNDTEKKPTQTKKSEEKLGLMDRLRGWGKKSTTGRKTGHPYVTNQTTPKRQRTRQVVLEDYKGYYEVVQTTYTMQGVSTKRTHQIVNLYRLYHEMTKMKETKEFWNAEMLLKEPVDIANYEIFQVLVEMNFAISYKPIPGRKNGLVLCVSTVDTTKRDNQTIASISRFVFAKITDWMPEDPEIPDNTDKHTIFENALNIIDKFEAPITEESREKWRAFLKTSLEQTAFSFNNAPYFQENKNH